MPTEDYVRDERRMESSRTLRRPKKPQPPASYADNPSIAPPSAPPSPPPVGYFGQQNAPGTETRIESPTATAPSPTRPAGGMDRLSPVDRAESLRRKAELIAMRNSITQQRMNAARSGLDVRGYRDQEDRLSQEIINIHRATSPTTLDQTPEQIASKRADLQRQAVSAQAAIRGQYAADTAAAQAPVDARQKAAMFFLGAPSNDPIDQERRNIEGDLERQIAEGGGNQVLRQTIQQNELRRLAEAKRQESAYQPNAQIDFAPIDETARQAARDVRSADVGRERQVLNDQRTARAGAQTINQNAAASEVAASESARLKAEIERNQLQQQAKATPGVGQTANLSPVEAVKQQTQQQQEVAVALSQSPEAASHLGVFQKAINQASTGAGLLENTTDQQVLERQFDDAVAWYTSQPQEIRSAIASQLRAAVTEGNVNVDPALGNIGALDATYWGLRNSALYPAGQVFGLPRPDAQYTQEYRGKVSGFLNLLKRDTMAGQRRVNSTMRRPGA